MKGTLANLSIRLGSHTALFFLEDSSFVLCNDFQCTAWQLRPFVW